MGMRLFEGTEFDIPPRCDRCNALEADCECGPPPVERRPPSEQTAVVSTEKRKRGKVVTLIAGLAEPDTDMAQLVTTLKDFCGAGGTLKSGAIEIQGKVAERVQQKLRNLGYNVQRS